MSIVACDDHEMFLSALVEALADQGHQVLAATANPRALLGLVEELQPRLVLLDVQLPEVSGVELAQIIRERHAGTAIILLSAATDGDDAKAAYDVGIVDGLVCKSIAIQPLDIAIRRVLAGERVMVGWPTPPPSRNAASPLDQLTRRELEVLILMANGSSTASMATRMGVSVNTVRTHVAAVLQKLRVHQRSEAAHMASQWGLRETG